MLFKLLKNSKQEIKIAIIKNSVYLKICIKVFIGRFLLIFKILKGFCRAYEIKVIAVDKLKYKLNSLRKFIDDTSYTMTLVVLDIILSNLTVKICNYNTEFIAVGILIELIGAIITIAISLNSIQATLIIIYSRIYKLVEIKRKKSHSC